MSGGDNVASSGEAEGDCELWIHSDQAGSVFIKQPSRYVRAVNAKDRGPILTVVAPMPCKVIRMEVKDGETVKKGALLVVLESMKMEMKVYAEAGGTVKLMASVGQIIKQGSSLLTLTDQAKLKIAQSKL